MWDKGQIIVILSWTKFVKNIISVGGGGGLYYFCNEIFTYQETQWSEYMEEIICIITINSNEGELPARRVMTQAKFPYRIFDVYLP